MADDTLKGRRALVIVTNYGAEESELLTPIEYLRGHGADVTVAAKERGPIRTLVFDKDPGKEIEADTTFAEVDPTDFDVVVVPGGTLNADALRLEPEAQRIVKAFSGAGRPIAAICHAPWLLAEAGLTKGASLTSWQSLETDLRNAGADWKDEEVVVDREGGYALITSRSPNDLDAFTAAISEALTAKAA